MMPSRPLTSDERLASDAAFRGTPFNPRWSQTARRVYDGLRAAIANAGTPDCPEGLPPPSHATTQGSVRPLNAEWQPVHVWLFRVERREGLHLMVMPADLCGKQVLAHLESLYPHRRVTAIRLSDSFAVSRLAEEDFHLKGTRQDTDDQPLP